MKTLNIDGRKVCTGSPCFVIAEAGVNHNGSLEMALDLIDVAAGAGVDAVKFQTFHAHRLTTLHAPKASYQIANCNVPESQLEMLRRLELTPRMHEKLIQRCHEHNICFLSTPFDECSVDLLEQLDVAAYKIPSGEITNLTLLQHVARKGKPMIVSTGMCNLGEVEAAVEMIENEGNPEFAILHCVSNYPADPADVNLQAMHVLQEAFQCCVGYSDHTLGIDIATAAVARGACILEKHFTLDRSLPGPDHRASLEPQELVEMVSSIRRVERALGSGRKTATPREKNTAEIARKSLVAAKDIPAGTQITEDLIVMKRPGTGLGPAMKPHLIDRTAGEDIPAGTILSLKMVA